MLFQLVGEVLCCGQSKTRSNDTFDAVGRKRVQNIRLSRSLPLRYRNRRAYSRGLVCQVDEHGDTLERSVLFEILLEESGGLHVDTHGCEHNGEVVLVAVEYAFGGSLHETGLSTDLCGDLGRVVKAHCWDREMCDIPHCGGDRRQRRWESSVHEQ